MEKYCGAVMENKLAELINGKSLVQLEPIARDIAATNGVVDSISHGTHASYFQVLPITLIPSPFPKTQYQQALKVQKDLNLLYHKAACDYDFLRTSLEANINCDDFTARLWSIYETVREEGEAQHIVLGLNRSDYMVGGCANIDEHNASDAKLRQVEFNLMSCGHGAIAKRLVPLHQTITELANACNNNMDNGVIAKATNYEIPENDASLGLAKGIFEAWRLYGTEKQASTILFVVLPADPNIIDQRLLELQIYRQNPRCTVIRKTLSELKDCAKLSDDRRLLVDGEEVGVVYFRAGNSPSHFPDDGVWNVRLLIERSRAIKCPCVQYMLVNTRIVQQQLSNSKTIQKYMGDSSSASERIANIFVGQYSLRNSAVVKDALSNPAKYVLKPSGKCQGPIFYDDSLVAKLVEIVKSKAVDAYVLMDRIRPSPFYNYVLTHTEKASLINMVSELGIFGVFIGVGDKTVHANFASGYLMRSKGAPANQGDVPGRRSYLDSPYLIDL